MAALMGVLTGKLVIAMTILLQSYAMQAQPVRSSGRSDFATVHSRALEGNLLGDSADRSVIVYLPQPLAAKASEPAQSCIKRRRSSARRKGDFCCDVITRSRSSSSRSSMYTF